ncbi:MAG: cofactor-independent phosphoglycerate mutase [Candidatus Adiutrix sp.]|jgi:2,3-bisphosphoglycerate-independent phosphoglycerate mutase|nr:cofactor-independent phosphoglycerate mutase [Candidatus Adiutrix sp.]
MKYVLMIGDGMGDWPLEELQGRTPLETAPTPNLDFMARNGILGLARTTPPGMAPGSDVAIMSLMGYYPKGVLSGRGPLEAASQGLSLAPDEMAFRINLVTLEQRGTDVFMRNHAAGNITTEEAAELIEALKAGLPLTRGQKLHPGVSYRHLMLWPAPAPLGLPSWPPHDYRDRRLNDLLDDPAAGPIMDLVRASRPILENHPVNVRRREKGLPPANAIWPWGQGFKAAVRSCRERWGLSGATVSAVDLIKGLGVSTGLKSLDVPGATGWLDSNLEGKVKAALQALKESDYVVIHFEAPDEASHQGELGSKLQAIGDFDARVAGPLLQALRAMGEFRVLAACDHFTPLKIKTHSDDPVPFIIYSQPPLPGRPASGLAYSERNAASTGLLVDPGSDLSRIFFGPEKGDGQ